MKPLYKFDRKKGWIIPNIDQTASDMLKELEHVISCTKRQQRVNKINSILEDEKKI